MSMDIYIYYTYILYIYRSLDIVLDKMNNKYVSSFRHSVIIKLTIVTKIRIPVPKFIATIRK